MRFKNIIQRYPVTSYFILTFAISWLGAFILVAPDLLRKQPITKLDGLLMFPVMITGPALASILLTRIIEGKQGLRNLWSRIGRWRLPLKWWLIALLIPPCLILTTLLLLKREIIVMNLFKGRIMLVFPSGAKVNDTSGFLEGDYKDGRRIVIFKDMADVRSKEKLLQSVIKKWLELVEK